MSNRHPTANASQRARRAKARRVDYYPSAEALAIMEGKRSVSAPCNNASGILDTILSEWAWLINNQWESNGGRECGQRAGISDTRANDSGRRATARSMTTNVAAGPCGARTKAGHPCKARGLPRTRRCKWHGGMSTGPRTPEGKARALANLRQNRPRAQGDRS